MIRQQKKRYLSSEFFTRFRQHHGDVVRLDMTTDADLPFLLLHATKLVMNETFCSVRSVFRRPVFRLVLGSVSFFRLKRQ
jgi:hypothetical protein